MISAADPVETCLRAQGMEDVLIALGGKPYQAAGEVFDNIKKLIEKNVELRSKVVEAQYKLDNYSPEKYIKNY